MGRDAKIGKGQCSLMDDHVNEALTVMKEVASDLEMASIFNTCAVLNMRQGRHQSGMNLYQSGLKALGKDARLQARLFFNMGIGYRRWGKRDKALQAFTQAQKLDPHFKRVEAQIELMNAGTAPASLKKDEAKDLVHQTLDAGMVDFNTDLASLLDEDLEETLFKKKEPA